MTCPNCGGHSNQIIGVCCLCSIPGKSPGKSSKEFRSCCIDRGIATYCLEDDCWKVICESCRELQTLELKLLDRREAWCLPHMKERWDEYKQADKEIKEIIMQQDQDKDREIERLKDEIARLNVIIERSMTCNHVHVIKGPCLLQSHEKGEHIYRRDR